MRQEKETYYKFSRYLKKRFGGAVYKITVDAGFSCPNTNGKLSKDGCIYCDNRAFSLNALNQPKPVEDQIHNGISFAKKRYRAKKVIVYFQPHTNTYASCKVLKKRYDLIRSFPNVVGISIGTRPDCINDKILDLVESYAEDYEVWLEYGLQSMHEKTLKFINRGHTYADFIKAVDLTRKRKGIKICAHVIIGLPNETRYDVCQTAKALGMLDLDGVKIHPLYIVKGTKMEQLLNEGSYHALSLKQYANSVTDFLEYLSPRVVIQRLAADCPDEFLVGPLWVAQKTEVLACIEEKLTRERRYQGRLFKY